MGEVCLAAPEPIQCSTSCGLISRGHTKICFGENQLSPSLIGLSPLPSSHPSGFQPTTVRASTTCYGRFTLLKGRSPRLRVYRRQRRRPIQTRFRFGSGPEGLNLLPTSNSPGHNAKGTPSEDTTPKCRASSDRLLAHGFRICFTRHLAFFSPFPHGTGALSVTEECLALEGGPPSFPQDCTCPAVLGIPLGVVDVDLPGFHRLWRAIPGRFGLVSYSQVAVPQPRRSKLRRFGLSPVRSPLLGGSRLLSFPPGTEMFHFPGFARALRPVTRVAPRRVAPFGDPGITARVQLPQAYRSLPRPSSPLGAKASTVRRMVLDLKTRDRLPEDSSTSQTSTQPSVVKERTPTIGDVSKCGRLGHPFMRRQPSRRLLGIPERR